MILRIPNQPFPAKIFVHNVSLINLWTIDNKEYNLVQTLNFLTNLYSNIDMKNLIESQVAVIYPDPLNKVQQYSKEKGHNAKNVLGSKGDVSLMYLVYGVSIILLLIVLMKFISKKNGRCLGCIVSHCQRYTSSRKKSKRESPNLFMV